jgi:hypothetical protein
MADFTIEGGALQFLRAQQDIGSMNVPLAGTSPV